MKNTEVIHHIYYSLFVVVAAAAVDLLGYRWRWGYRNIPPTHHRLTSHREDILVDRWQGRKIKTKHLAKVLKQICYPVRIEEVVFTSTIHLHLIPYGTENNGKCAHNPLSPARKSQLI